MKMPAKRRFGQHFLRDTGIIERIVDLIAPSPDQAILEVGAGRGALSVKLAQTAGRLYALELDDECIPLLKSSLAAYPAAIIVQEDMLKLDLPALLAADAAGPKRVRVVGNLPYNIATPFIERVLSPAAPVEDMVFMVQLEVGQRITASPGTKEYGYLSVHCQHFADVAVKFKVAPECFVPRPRVMSAVITMRPRMRGWPPMMEQSFLDVASAAFRHRRKTLFNSIRLSSLPPEIVIPVLEGTGISGARRAEDLTVEEFERLAIELFQTRSRMRFSN